MSTLRDRRIVVARDPERAAPLVRYCHEAGARASALALTQSVGPLDGGLALEAAADRIDEFDWILFTSARGVRALDLYPSLAHATRYACVGPSTAQALETRGYRAEVVASGDGGVALAELLIARYPDAGPLLFIGAQIPAGGMLERLRDAGMIVEHVASYATVPRELTAGELESLEAADIVVVAAPSAVSALARYVLPSSAVLVASGPTTARAARDAGFRVVEASSSDFQAVFEALQHAVEFLS